MKLHITTQYYENYGPAEASYWKPKGEYDYFVLNVVEGEEEQVFEKVRDEVEYRNDFAMQTVISYSLVENDYETLDVRQQLEFDGEVTFPTPILELI